jgi:uncharacterized protein YndB with AHSA1/START domain
MATTRPESLAFVDLAPVRAEATRELDAAPEAVFDVLADAESWPQWFPNMQQCRWLTPPPHGVDSQREVRAGPLHVVERFIVWDRPRRWGFTFTAATPRIARAGAELVTLDPTGDGGTRVTYTMAVEPPAPAGLATLATGPMNATLAGALKGLARHLSSR